MLLSLSYMLLIGLTLGALFKKIKLPSLLGMLITGIILGPNLLNLIDDSILDISSPLRKIALIIILTRAGLNLNLKELKRVGRPAILMSFIPATFEIVFVTLFAVYMLKFSVIDGMLLGSVLTAVSPAVIVPKMLELIENKYGTKKYIPQMIMASSSVDDILVLIVFSIALSLSLTGEITTSTFLSIPIILFLGIFAGFALGYFLTVIFKKFHMRDTSKVIILLSISFILVSIEDSGIIPFSGLLAIITMNIYIKNFYEILSTRLSAKFSRLWVFAEIILFVLVGVVVDLNTLKIAGITSVILIILVMILRIISVSICLINTNFNYKERFFCAISYIPKATVQAGIGAIPLSEGIKTGNYILVTAVLAILITASIGAILMDMFYIECLEKD